MEIEELTIEGTLASYRAGEFTAVELVRAYLDRIDRIDRSGPRLNSLLAVGAESALSAAEGLDSALAQRGGFVGPLHGIPLIVKDQVESVDLPTTFGSDAVKDYRPREDATALAKLRAAGAIVLAKSTMPDFATSWFSTSSVSGQTKNPYVLDRDPGGSSSGTAASVAANLALAGIGEDTGGSIRLPASFCNLVGLRVTPGLISRAGMSPLVEPQDTPGPMTRTVADAARLLDVMVGYDEQDPYTAAYVLGGEVGDYTSAPTADLSEVAIGVLRQAFPGDGDAEGAAVAEVIDAALACLESAGARLVDVEIEELDRLVGFTSVYYSRSRQDINRFFASRPELGIESIESLKDAGNYHEKLDLFEGIAASPASPDLDPEYLQRILAQAQFQREVIGVYRRHGIDAIAFPDVRLPAPLASDVLGDRWTCLTYPTNTVIASQLLFPAITLPAGFTAAGLPVGIELMATPYRERSLLGLATAAEDALKARRAPQLG